MKISCFKLLILAAIAYAAVSLTLEQSHDIEHEFCWKDSYGRGVGIIPTDCGSKRKLGLLCYDHCPHGYSPVGLNCNQNCLDGWADQGLFCRLAQYGRGWGYGYWASDWFQSQPRVDRCEHDHGRGNCEWWGAVVYPKCRPGFHPFGCCICRPEAPNCNALGYNGGIDLSCAKRVLSLTPYSASCSSDREQNAGLCYQRCKQGYYGVGPVCWSHAPKGWVDCGMGAAKDTKTCAQTIVGQITSIGEMALNIATMVATAGASAGATAGTKVAAGTGKIAQIKAKMLKVKDAFMKSDKIKKLVEKAKEIKNKGEKIKGYVEKVEGVIETANEVATQDYSNFTEADYVRLAGQIVALADPTGVAGVIENYSHPICSHIFK